MSAASDETGIDYPVTTHVHLYDDAAYVDIELTIEKPADIWPEAGWICLPFKVDDQQFRVGRNGFIMDPAGILSPERTAICMRLERVWQCSISRVDVSGCVLRRRRW